MKSLSRSRLFWILLIIVRIRPLSSLLWIGTTYFDLGEGLSGGKIPPPEAAAKKFQRSAESFSKWLKRVESQPELATAQEINAVRLRMVRCRRKQGQFEEAIRLVRGLLSVQPMSIEGQLEAAYTYLDAHKQTQQAPNNI